MPHQFSERDLQEIKTRGLTPEQVAGQLDIFSKGTFYYRLNRPCRVGDGIISVPEEEKSDLVALYEREESKGRMLKFVPASGAASRMFKDWHGVLAEGPDAGKGGKIIDDLQRYAFYRDLDGTAARQGMRLAELLAKKDIRTVLELILTPRGLNYANLPKALLKFHHYPDGKRTAIEEHLVEAALYAHDRSGTARIHFTVSEEHKALIEDILGDFKAGYEKRCGVTYEIGLSTQSSSTDTIAVDLGNRIFRDQTGVPVFRPGGHGALIRNLEALQGDIVLVKNIDNIVPDRLKTTTVQYKKILGGLLLRTQERIFGFLKKLSSGADSALIAEIVRFCEKDLGMLFPQQFAGLELQDRRDYLMNRLDRPLRVCGVVKNEGEPGGGPFWIDEEDGTQSLQIIESAQVDFRSNEQKAAWDTAGYFNPVDLACGVRDLQGKPFNLDHFIDKRAYFISEKSQSGRDLKALEYPGLWNGAMALWNTLFMEVPIETFNPVKTIEDLLRPQHS